MAGIQYKAFDFASENCNSIYPHNLILDLYKLQTKSSRKIAKSSQSRIQCQILGTIRLQQFGSWPVVLGLVHA